MKVAVLPLYSHNGHLELETNDIQPRPFKKSSSPSAPSGSRAGQAQKTATSPFSMADHVRDHCLPLPLDGSSIDATLLGVLAMFQFNAITALGRVAKKTDDQVSNLALNSIENLAHSRILTVFRPHSS